jgi:uncharacterized RDD family membrane protein YckC
LSETNASMAVPPSPIARFWSRALAFLIDGIVVGTIGEIVGFAFREPLENIHAWQRLVGFLIAAAYFVPLDSRLGRGQTLGKRVMKIAVVGRDGAFVGVGRVSLRFSVLAVPVFANGIDLGSDPGVIVDTLLTVVIFGLGFSLAYLYAANRRTRQSLHDLASDTFVCRAAAAASGLHERVWRGHLAVVGIICLIPLVLGLVGSSLISSEQKARFADMQKVQAAALTVPGTWSASVLTQTTVFNSMSGPDRTTVTNHFLVVSVRVDAHAGDDKAVARAVAQKVLEAAPDLLGQPALRITILHGVDLGIASATRGYSDTESAERWKASQDTNL